MKNYRVVRSRRGLSARARELGPRPLASDRFASSGFPSSGFPSSRVVSSLLVSGWLVSGLLACGASNGTLFDEELGGGAGAEPPPVGSSEASPPAVEPPEPRPAAPPGAEVPSSDLPLTGEPPAPVNGTPAEPSPGEPPAEAEGLAIVAVSPANGAVGVANDQSIVIEFSAPMDRASTEAAYQSESIPSGSVSFLWNDAGTELTIVPEAPLAYPLGPDPAAIEPRRVSFFISASAADLEGRRLSAPFESSFSLLRRVELSLAAVRDRDLSGSFRSNDTYGAGQCARGEVNMCVGDVRVNRRSEQYRGFISFELPELPDEARSIEAQLRLEVTGVSGNPFASLGGLLVEHARFDAIGLEAFAAEGLAELGLIAGAGGMGATLGADVGAAFLADQHERRLTQYRLRFEDATDGDNTSDAFLSAWDTQAIDVSYLIP